MKVITDQWVYIHHQKYGYLHTQTPSNTKKVEVVIKLGFQDQDAFLWKIHKDQGQYFIQNKAQGFLYVAPSDDDDQSSQVYCDPNIYSLNQVQIRNTYCRRWHWDIYEEALGLRLRNGKYGSLFTYLINQNQSTKSLSSNKYKKEIEVLGRWSMEIAFPTASWMGSMQRFIASKRLNHLLLPGAYRSGSHGIKADAEVVDKRAVTKTMYAICKTRWVGKKIKGIWARWYRTQNYTIKEQLEAGIRYLDFEVVRKGNTYYACNLLRGTHMQEILLDIKEFLQQHPKEILLLNFGKLHNMDSSEENKPFIQQLLKALYPFMAGNHHSPNDTVSSFWEAGYQVITFYNHSPSIRSCPVLWSPHDLHTQIVGQVSDPRFPLDTFLSRFSSFRPDNKFRLVKAIKKPRWNHMLKGLLPKGISSCSPQNLAESIQPMLQEYVNYIEENHFTILVMSYASNNPYTSIIIHKNVNDIE